ncbi:condensation domain-containing protein, partial [Microbulbifer sp. TYP-18]|uniref:condensation domain-containing protein n=1 Tax=Microbulbifer sp. TYP-18 TaxID=3230024 RepID=UPI0034C6451A
MSDDPSVNFVLDSAHAQKRSGTPLLLSPIQKRLWFLSQFTGPSHILNLFRAWQLRGSTGGSELEQQLRKIIERHELLRARFTVEAGAICQVFDRPVDACVFMKSCRECEVKSIVQRERSHVFNVNEDALCRLMALSCIDTGRVYVLITLHQLIADDRSLTLLADDLQKYAADVAQTPKGSFSKYSMEQNALAEQEEYPSLLTFWRVSLQNIPALLTLPAERARPPERTYRGGHLTAALRGDLIAGLPQLGHSHDLHLDDVFLAAFMVLLNRYTRQEHIAVGTAIDYRTGEDARAVVGPLTNTLPVCGCVSDDPRVLDFIRQIARVREQVCRHGKLPFEQLVDELSMERNLSYAPVFQALMTVERDHEAGPAQWSPVDSSFEGSACIALYDLALKISMSSGGVSARLEYSCDLFEADWAEGLLAHYQQLLAAMVATPERRLSQ